MNQIENEKKFIKAGKAIFTFKNEDSGNRYTYKVKKLDGKDIWFVSLLSGPDNHDDYTYLGTIFENDQFKLTKKSHLKEDSVPVKAFKWVWKKIIDNSLPNNVKVYHEGRCGRCGRRLTVPESIISGFGPECINHV